MVVFPAPLGPSRPNTSPSSIVRSTPATAAKSPYRFTSPLISMTATEQHYGSVLRLGTGGGPMVTPGVRRHAFFGYSMLVVGTCASYCPAARMSPQPARYIDPEQRLQNAASFLGRASSDLPAQRQETTKATGQDPSRSVRRSGRSGPTWT